MAEVLTPPQGRLARRGAGPRRRTAGPRRHHRAGHAARPVPAPALGRPAPARDDRDGADVRPRTADRRRADHRARRHRAGADPAAARRRCKRELGLGDPADHPRPRHRRARRRPCVGHVCRRGGRERADRGTVRARRSIPTRAACCPACRCRARCSATSRSARSRAWCRAIGAWLCRLRLPLALRPCRRRPARSEFRAGRRATRTTIFAGSRRTGRSRNPHDRRDRGPRTCGANSASAPG